ncbi:tetratricopeptide repeat protein [Wenzhouxiangella sp. XN24]|uniref:tetratricopeptide repeat protein n=1 Tax=Wenzhouxiangella sp. XN24 TaxID=2713569 RepID=UPI0013ED7109|nr:tetratricopeptide repeat protein [Wenzhouxiangella sp. XN24]NGX17146.1 tetratricopeptide repeat protein [Wenzhouxiangella sp. XN24]
MSFFAELKRRNVIRVGLAYVVAAWVVIQVMEIAADAFEAPAWVLKLVVTMFVIGLLPALVFSWVYELTPEGLKRESEVRPEESAVAHTAKKLNLAVIVLLLAAMGMFLADRFMSSRSEPPAMASQPPGVASQRPAVASQPPAVASPQPPATTVSASGEPATRAASPGAVADSLPEDAVPVVAVLPFAARSMGGEEGRFLADGIHDDLLTQLAKLEIFRVVSRTSVMEYLDTTKNMRQIGEELGAGHILEGGLQQAGGRVRINAQLIDAVTDEHLWAETFERELTPDAIFEIQAEIAMAIATALKATLSAEEAAQLAQAPTSSQGAYEAFLQARLNTYVYDPDARKLSVRKFEDAVALDPDFAEAWGWLGFARLLEAWSDGITPQDEPLIASAREAIATARELEPGLPEADYAEAHYYYWVQADYAAALQLIEPLIARFPNNGDWMASRGWFNRRAGNWEEAVADLTRALELDPRNGFVALELANFYIQLRQWDQAVPALEHALAISGDRDTYLGYLARLRLDCCGELSVAREFASRLHDTGRDSMLLAQLLRVDGKPGEALALLEGYGPETSEPGPDENWLTAIILLRETGDEERMRAEADAYRRHLETFLIGHEEYSLVHRDLAFAFLALGEREKALSHFADVERLLRPDAVRYAEADTFWAETFAMFGEHDLAFEHLASTLERPAGISWHRVRLSPAFDGIRNDPRYAALEQEYQVAD